LQPRLGRPKSENPKDTIIKARIDKETEVKLDAYCKTHSITRTEAIRQGIHLLLAKEK